MLYYRMVPAGLAYIGRPSGHEFMINCKKLFSIQLDYHSMAMVTA